jgi:hypothetical protein
MGVLDDWMAKFRGEATKQAGKAATAAATAAAAKAASGIAEDFLSFAEGELSEARGARGLQDGEEPPALVPGTDGPQVPNTEARPSPVAEAPVQTARECREAAEAKARDELARLKAEMAAKKSS